MRLVFLGLSLVVLCAGLYLKLIHDVPDGQETINSFTSGFFMIVGTSGLLVSLLWKAPRRSPRDEE
jgi:heme/copper-type cytochrome/quinol oxidase subunit 3